MPRAPVNRRDYELWVVTHVVLTALIVGAAGFVFVLLVSFELGRAIIAGIPLTAFGLYAALMMRRGRRRRQTRARCQQRLKADPLSPAQI
jgi:hypothetical protein